jgi:hypothetical protein
MVSALFLLPLNGVSLQLRGYQKTLKHASNQSIANNTAPDPCAIAAARKIARLVNIAARYGPYRAKCLTRSLTVIQMMNRRGLSGGKLVLGAKTETESFAAHAWVELNGEVVNDSERVGGHFSRFGSSGEESA